MHFHHTVLKIIPYRKIHGQAALPNVNLTLTRRLLYAREKQPNYDNS